MKIDIVIGKNFGDEGKGLAVDLFAKEAQDKNIACLVIKHNGGAQAGHTVDLPMGRFIFHQLSSGSFRGADTFWDKTYLPDLYKLGEEIEDYGALPWRPEGPHIYASPDCLLVLLDDVLINQALEASRGDAAHGSCGMGINEAVQRTAHKDYQFSVGELLTKTEEELLEKLRNIRSRYTRKRLEELHISSIIGPYLELLTSDYVLEKEAMTMVENRRYVDVVSDMKSFFGGYEQLIFEGAQGLLLDDLYEKYAPHLTPSRTGCHNPLAFLREHGLLEEKPTITYVTRSYVTRHGAGPLPYEITDFDCRANWTDFTNVPNPWQGTLRYARHGAIDEFLEPICEDLREWGVLGNQHIQLLITHLNETNHQVWCKDRAYSVEEFAKEIEHVIGNCILSESPINE